MSRSMPPAIWRDESNAKCPWGNRPFPQWRLGFLWLMASAMMFGLSLCRAADTDTNTDPAVVVPTSGMTNEIYSALYFLRESINNGSLPGVSTNDHGEMTINYDGGNNWASGTLLMTCYLALTNSRCTCEYGLFRAAKDSPWQLQRAIKRIRVANTD